MAAGECPEEHPVANKTGATAASICFTANRISGFGDLHDFVAVIADQSYGDLAGFGAGEGEAGGSIEARTGVSVDVGLERSSNDLPNFSRVLFDTTHAHFKVCGEAVCIACDFSQFGTSRRRCCVTHSSYA